MNYRNVDTGEVIGDGYYQKLPLNRKSRFVETESEPTHYISDYGGSSSNGLLETVLFAEILSDSGSDVWTDSSPSIDTTDTTTDSTVEFGGGEFGGGGAGADW